MFEEKKLQRQARESGSHESNGSSHAPKSSTPFMVAQRQRLTSAFGAAAYTDVSSDATPEVAQREAAPEKTNNTGLPNQLKSGIESLSGMSMDHVKVHYNSSKPAQLNAHAYAQGSQIHLAPGQERHLPHEAWHVVQQAQGRVKATTQMKETVPVNDDTGLEHEADLMGAKAMSVNAKDHSDIAQRYSTSASNIVQKQNVQPQAALLGAAYAQGPNTNLYNSRPAINLAQGYLYTRALPAVHTAAGTAGVLDAYIVAARAIGTALAGREYLDRSGNPPDIPSVANWGARGAGFLANLAQWTNSDPNAFANMQHRAALTLRENLHANRTLARDTANIGLIDPFIVELTIQQVGQPQPWIIQTNFSNSALGYIVDIQLGTNNVRGHLAATPEVFAGVAALAPAIGGFAYSPDHDVLNTNTIGAQIGSVQPGATNAANHIGLDAVTKLAAEGARFEPVRQLGTNLKISSIFYTVDAHGDAKQLDFRLLYQHWGDWFQRGYGITALAVKAEVQTHGTPLNRPVQRAHDYDLDNEGPSVNFAAHYTAYITQEVNNINRLQQNKVNYARGKGSRKQQAIAAFNRGKNSQIDQINRDLKPYRNLYPDLYQTVLRPPALPVVILPAVGPGVGPGVGGGHIAVPGGHVAGAGGGQGISNYRKIVIGGVAIGTLILANEIYRFMYSQSGLLYDWNKDV